MLILSVESTCDETAVAVTENGRKVLTDQIFSQADLHAVYGGVVPEIASRSHVEVISRLAALVAAAAIPNERIYDNMYKSAMFFKDHAPYVNESQLRLVQDNYADSILLNVTWNMGSDPFVSTLNSAYYDGNDGTTDYGENWGFYCTLAGTPPNKDYSRYWHGMAALIRPFMLFTDIDGIKLIGTIAAFVLLAVSAVLLLTKGQYFAAGVLTVSLLCVHIWNIGISLEYQPAVLVTLLPLPLYILFEKNDGMLSMLAVVSGVMIAFFDFLTCETLTILIPLLIVFIMKKQENRLPDLKNIPLPNRHADILGRRLIHKLQYPPIHVQMNLIPIPRTRFLKIHHTLKRCQNLLNIIDVKTVILERNKQRLVARHTTTYQKLRLPRS